jgi:two-component system response regulator YesN
MYKVMLVEDENILRKGIEVLTNWDALNCNVVYGASNGVEAYEYAISNPVDIVITDIRMPGLDGLELTKKLKKINSKIAVIILSAYGEFSYAQSALSLDVKQYVLKSNYRDDLPKAIKITIDALEKKSDNIKFCQLFFKTTTECEILKFFESNIEIDVPYFVLNIETSDLDSLVDFNQFILYAYKALSPMVFTFNNSFHYLLVQIEKGSFDRVKTILSMSEDFIKSCNTLINCNLNIGISRESINAVDFSKALSQSRDSLGSLYCLNKCIINNGDIFLPTKIVDCGAISKIIIDSFIGGDYLLIEKSIDNFFLFLEENNYGLINCKQQIEVLFNILGTTFQERNLNLEYFLECVNGETAKLNNCFSCITVKNKVIDVLNVLCEKYMPYMNDSISRTVKNYIKNNYMNQITIEDISEFMHLSTNYIGRIFKKETGRNVLQYLNEYKVEKAKILLNEGKYQINEITFMVGYSNPAYFSNVFRRVSGVSPKKFMQKS